MAQRVSAAARISCTSTLPRVTTREVVESFWSAMTANDWERAAAHLADDCVVDWPCSGERFGREHFAEIQARYPAAAEWRFDLHRLIVEGRRGGDRADSHRR